MLSTLLAAHCADTNISDSHHESTTIQVQQPPMSTRQLRSGTSTNVPVSSLHQYGESEQCSSTRLTSTPIQHNAEPTQQQSAKHTAPSLTEPVPTAPSLTELVPLLCAAVLSVLFLMSTSQMSHSTSTDVTSESSATRRNLRAHEHPESRQGGDDDGNV